MLRPHTFTHPSEIQIAGTNSTFYRVVRAGGIMLDVVSRTAEELFIPLTVGGGLRSLGLV